MYIDPIRFDQLNRIILLTKNTEWNRIEDIWIQIGKDELETMRLNHSTVKLVLEIMYERKDREIIIDGPVLKIGRWRKKGLPESIGL